MEQEEGLLIPTKIKSENEYKLESKTNTGSASFPNSLPFFILLIPTLSLIPNNLLPPYTINQYSSINYKLLAQQ